MTREEALRRVKGYLTDIIPTEDYSEVEEIIKALEQESCNDVLNKIGCEIEEIETYDGCYVDRAYVLQILDKYQAKSEVQDADRKITNNNRWTDGAIVYKPHCSKCGMVINERVAYRNIITELGSYKNLVHPTTEVSPSRCRCCNQLFNRIEIQIPEQQPTEYLV